MEEAQIRFICKLYGISPLQKFSPLSGGTAARVWRLDTPSRACLLRTLASPAQGELEWAVAQHLTARGFTHFPAILPTAAGAPMAEVGGGFYQMQVFCPGTRPDPDRPGVSRQIGETAADLTRALAGFVPAAPMPDRFALSAAWCAGREGFPRLGLPLTLSEADRTAARLAVLPERDVQLIHGDLGLWNMLDDRGVIRVIDFGEARLGDPYFDLASALAGLVNHSSPERRAQNAAAFLVACGERLPLDLPRLKGQLALWAWRGIAQCAARGEPFAGMAARMYGALRTMEEWMP